MRHHGTCCLLEADLESLYTGNGADLYDALSQGDDCGIETLIQELRAADVRSVADLGAGAGRVTLPLLDAGFDVVAVDLSTDMLSILERRASEQGASGRLDAVHSDMLDCAKVCEPQDAVVIVTSNLTMFDAASRARCLSAATALLKPGGLLVVEIYQIDPGTPELGTFPLPVRGTFTEQISEDARQRRVTVRLDGREYLSTTHLVDGQGIAREMRAALGADAVIREVAEPVSFGRWNVQLFAHTPARQGVRRTAPKQLVAHGSIGERE